LLVTKNAIDSRILIGWLAVYKAFDRIGYNTLIEKTC
jgi:hypothetical protein